MRQGTVGIRRGDGGTVAAEQRRRILDAVPLAIAEQGGYERAAVRHVIERAKLSRRTFYDQFRGRAHVFLTAYDESFEYLFEAVVAAWAAHRSWPAKVAAAVQIALECAVIDPAITRMVLIDPLCADPAIATHHRYSFDRFIPLLREGRPQASAGACLPELLEQALIGSACDLVAARLHGEEAASLLALSPELTEFLLTPYLSSGCEEG